MFKRFFATVVVVLLLSGVSAAATLFGESGMINIPNADALQPAAMEASVHAIDGGGVLAVNFGLIPQVEVGVNTLLNYNDLNLIAKGVLLQETKNNPGIAVGLENKGAYIVFSRSFANRVRGHIGFGNERFNGLFAGISTVLNPVSVSKNGSYSPVTTLMLEHDGRMINAGARIAFTPNLKLDLSLLDLNTGMVGLSFNTSF